MSETIRIPFSVVGLLLPLDGRPPQNPAARPIVAQNVLAVWKGKTRPDWDGKTDFEKGEQAELAFGYKLRADPAHRDGGEERTMGPGFATVGDHVRIQGSWRAHRSTRVIPDWFDGTFSGELRFRIERVDDVDSLRLLVSNISVGWHNTFPVVEALDGWIEGIIEDRLEATLQEHIDKAMARLKQAIVATDQLTRLRSRTTVSVEGTDVHFTFDVAQDR